MDTPCANADWEPSIHQCQPCKTWCYKLLARPAVRSVPGVVRHPGKRRGPTKTLKLTRQLLLKCVKMTIYSQNKQQPHLKLGTSHSFLLQLCPRQF